MKISHAWLQEYFEEKLPDANALAELLTFHSFEIEGVEDKGDDQIIDAKILPDRAHFCLSYKGIAEEVRVLTGLEYAKPSNPLYEKGKEGDLLAKGDLTKVEVKIESSDFCRRYVSRLINNVSVQDSPLKVRIMLEAMDGRSINTVVDAANLAMFDVGQPLHAYDADKVSGTILVRNAKEGETMTLLDGREITLAAEDYVIADNEGPLALAGVKGGKRAEVTKDTKNLIIESANFHPTTIRKTASKYNLRNESSKRFENEITPEIALDGMNRTSFLIAKFSPDAIFGPISDLYPRPVLKNTILIKTSFINQKLGIEVKTEEIKEILKNLSIEIEEGKDDWVLTIPFHRLDLTLKEDIVEEIGRVIGYDKIVGKVHRFEGNVPAHPGFYRTQIIKKILQDEDFFEASLYALVPKGDFEVVYPLASDKKALRTNLTEGLVKSMQVNIRNAEFLFLDKIKVFEIGNVFPQGGEHTSLCIGISFLKKFKGQSVNEDIRQLREKLLEKLGISMTTVCTIDDTGGLLMIKNPEGKMEQVGVINNVDGVMEINLDKLIPFMQIPSHEEFRFVASPSFPYKHYSPYPFIVRDVAVFVPDSVRPEEIESIIKKEGTELLQSYHLFDTFQKDGKISYAFRMIFQSFERTLTDDEVTPIMAHISSQMAQNGWEVR